MYTADTSPLSGLSRPVVSFLAPNVARWTLALLSLWVRTEGVAQTPLPQSVWIEGEHLLGIKGANFSYFKDDRQAKGVWGISGPGVAAEWTQGGESEWMSIAARADETAATASLPFEAPVSERYRLWVRYADYREAREEFGIRISQNSQVKVDHRFGTEPVIDENDQMKLFWKWAFGWDFVEVELSEGPALLEIYTPGPTEARRQVDCFCLTTDKEYRPHHKDKPMMAAWRPLEAYLKEGRPPRAPLAARTNNFAVSPSWKLKSFPGHPLLMLWNVGDGWLKELANESSPWQKYPFHIDSGWTEDFKSKFAGREDLPIFSSPMIAPVLHIPFLPAQFSSDSPFLKWLTKTKRPFGILLNYGEPNFAATQESKESIFRSFSALKDQFVGYIAGESLGYLTYDAKDLNDRISAAKSRTEIYQILSRAFTEATNAKYTSYSGSPVGDGWKNVISCTSAGMLGYAHALGNWGCRWIGHEDHTSGAGLAMRLAFQRGAARQFGAGMLGYMSCNFGDAATIFSNTFLYAGPKYVYDNFYDPFAGAGVNWLMKDYYLQHLSGVKAFFGEEGFDEFWKPGGGCSGEFEVELSPKGRVVWDFMQTMQRHPDVGVPFTPVAFLLDQAHGWDPLEYSPGLWGFDPELNPDLLRLERHAAMIREWMNIAYYPMPVREASVQTGSEQSFVDGLFGDIFDVVVTAPNRTDIVSTYPVVIPAGRISLSNEWGRELSEYVQRGGTLVVTADQLEGPGVSALKLPPSKGEAKADSFLWSPTGETVTSNVFRYHPITNSGEVLARSTSGDPLVVAYKRGKGKLIYVTVPLGLGVDNRATPLLSLLMIHLTQDLLPVRVEGKVEYLLNRTDTGWLVTLLNNRGVNKPQHGIQVTDYSEGQDAILKTSLPVRSALEWKTEKPVEWTKEGNDSTARIFIPAGGIRLVEMNTEPRP